MTTGSTVDIHTSEESFALFFSSDVWQLIVDNTNEYATKKISHEGNSCELIITYLKLQITSNSLYSNWKDVTTDEMKAFIALILNMGIIQLPNLKDYWSTSENTNIPFFRTTFSRKRFLQIYGVFHPGAADGTTRQEKLKQLLDLLEPAFRSSYCPSQQIAIDESIIAFKGNCNYIFKYYTFITGRLGCIQYIKGKPHPWGIKAYALADSHSGYLYKVCIYLGKETDLLYPKHPHTVRVVLTLVEDLKYKGYDLYVDRFYNSPLLASELMKIKITITGVLTTHFN